MPQKTTGPFLCHEEWDAKMPLGRPPTRAHGGAMQRHVTDHRYALITEGGGLFTS